MMLTRLKITLYLILLVLSTPVILTAQVDSSMTWTSAINRAIQENPNLASAEASLEATRRNIGIAQSKFLPGFDVVGSISQSKTATFSETAGVLPASSGIVGGTITQMVFVEPYLANHKIQKLLYESAKEEYRNTNYLTVTSAGQAYVAVLFSLDLLEVQLLNKQITEKNLAAAQDRLDVGSTNKQEVLRWQTQLFANQQAIESQKASVIMSMATLNQLLHLPLESQVPLQELTIEEDGFVFSNQIITNALSDPVKAQKVRDYFVTFGLTNSPLLASLDQQMLAQHRQLQSTKRWAIPKFSASVGADAKFALDAAEQEELGSDLGFWKVGLTMHWPIISGGLNHNKVQQATSYASALDYQRTNLTTSVEQSIRSIVAVVISDFANIGLASDQADAAGQNYSLVYDAYLEGESSLLNLLDAQTQKLGADIASRIALYTFFVDLVSMEHAIGYFPFLEANNEVDLLLKDLENILLSIE